MYHIKVVMPPKTSPCGGLGELIGIWVNSWKMDQPSLGLQLAMNALASGQAAMGECLPGARPARARRATFLLTIPTSAPDLPSHGEAPQVDNVALHTFPTKHVAK